MTATADIDLSGQWSGIYNYPALYPPNSFEADDPRSSAA